VRGRHACKACPIRIATAKLDRRIEGCGYNRFTAASPQTRPHTTPAAVAAEIRSILRRDGSVEHARGVQWFFKEEIKSHGWYAADLRRLARSYTRSLQKESGLDFLVRVADQLFRGRTLEEKVVAVLLLEKLTSSFGDDHFALFESWLDRISSWADHDALVHYLIAPMILTQPARMKNVFK
jgi:hypothetical protein